jgi:hypothetical protein
MFLDFIKAFHGTDPKDLENQVNEYIMGYPDDATISIIYFTLETISVNSSADRPAFRMWLAFREEQKRNGK